MTDGEPDLSIRRAELARANLVRDLEGVLRTGDQLIQRGKSLIKKIMPVVIVASLTGFLLVLAIVERRRPRRRWRTEPSFVTQLLRRAAFSVVGILAARLAKQLPLPALPEPELKRQTRLRRGDVDPMLPRAERGPGQPRSRV